TPKYARVMRICKKLNGIRIELLTVWLFPIWQISAEPLGGDRVTVFAPAITNIIDDDLSQPYNVFRNPCCVFATLTDIQIDMLTFALRRKAQHLIHLKILRQISEISGVRRRTVCAGKIQ